MDGLWRDLFAEVGFAQQKLSGQRVFISNGTVFPLGVETDITLRPLDFIGGWRFPVGRVRPYVGGGLTLVSYEEESAFSGTGEDVSERASGPVLLAGVDVNVIRYLGIGAELRYRAVEGVLGMAGVSEHFGEDALGGVALAVRVAVGR